MPPNAFVKNLYGPEDLDDDLGFRAPQLDLHLEEDTHPRDELCVGPNTLNLTHRTEHTSPIRARPRPHLRGNNRRPSGSELA